MIPLVAGFLVDAIPETHEARLSWRCLLCGAVGPGVWRYSLAASVKQHLRYSKTHARAKRAQEGEAQ